MPVAIDREVRAFAFGLIMGVGGSPYKPREIVRLINERFGVKISTKTISNWKANLPEFMEKYKITDVYVKEVIDRGLFGDLREKGDAGEAIREEEEPQGQPLSTEGQKDDEKLPEGSLVFNSTADIISYVEGEGFIVGKSMKDMISILEANGLQVVDKENTLFGVENLFIEPFEIDVEAVGRSVTGNPVIMLYYAIEMKSQRDKGAPKVLDLGEWLTSCVVNIYNPQTCPNCGYVTKGVRLAVLFG